MLSVSNKNSCNESLTASASIIGNNCDLLVDILYRLPVKSLLVFKTVSKQWLTLISDPYFESKHHIRSRLFTPALFMKNRFITLLGTRESDFETLVMDERNGIDYIPFKTPIAVKLRSRLTLEQSCHGLLLCKIENGGLDTPYVVYNPSMRRCRTLPSPPFRKPDGPRVFSVTIAFDPAKSSYYEAVCVCKTDVSKDMCHIEIYSSKTDSWRDAGDPFPFSRLGTLSHSGVYWNGSVHWIDEWRAILHYYDIDCELMKKIAMPTVPREGFSRQIVYFNECRGHIYLIEMREDDMPRYDIWEMRMDYTGWNLKYYVDLSTLTTVYPRIMLDKAFVFIRFKLYVLLIEEDEDSSRLILWIGKDKVISYDLKTNNPKEMYDVINPDAWVEGFEYVETLAHP